MLFPLSFRPSNKFGSREFLFWIRTSAALPNIRIVFCGSLQCFVFFIIPRLRPFNRQRSIPSKPLNRHSLYFPPMLRCTAPPYTVITYSTTTFICQSTQLISGTVLLQLHYSVIRTLHFTLPALWFPFCKLNEAVILFVYVDRRGSNSTVEKNTHRGTSYFVLVTIFTTRSRRMRRAEHLHRLPLHQQRNLVIEYNKCILF